MPLTGLPEVPLGLKVDPLPRAAAEDPRERQSHVYGQATVAVDAYFGGGALYGDTQGFKVLFVRGRLGDVRRR